ncbi:acylneuraminate cytidylyltransferase family protein [Muribaculaceae bacterium Isolate-002 (NCI)]|jgi:N-acylneuraminate cytidylyltransferase|nr:acylneuraminate cytidylyltransferase family protein [Muribaculaceae bacterium Isolate-002 (NCI)]
MKPLIIIPARGGSKGIPKKNIAMLDGRPLIDYTIKAALYTAAPSQIILSTDSEEIASVARDCGLDTPYRRPAELATDTAGSREVILDAMDWAEREGREYDAVVLLQPTSPLRKPEDIAGAMALYDDSIDMVVSVAEARSNPYYNCFEADADGFLHVSKGDGLYTRRQDVPPAFEYNGAVYVINPQSIRKMAMGEFPRRVPYLMPAERSVDIDTPIDLIIASHLLAAAKH